MSSTTERKLVAIMFVDIADFTALSGEDEQKALALIDQFQSTTSSTINKYKGILHKELGDGFLYSFSTVSDSIRCGIQMQKLTKDIDDLNLRIGVHEGEVTVKGDDILGDDVNIAQRIVGSSPIGGIAISGKVQQNISSLTEFETTFIGSPEFKGVSKNVEVHCITSDDLPSITLSKITSKLEKKRFPFAKKVLFPFTGFILTLLGAAFWFIAPFISFATSHSSQNEYDTSIAVLYFDNIGNVENSYFADGLTEEIISRVSRIQNLRVIPRIDVKKYKSSDLGSREISKELNVGYILEGTVRKNNNHIRINVNLIEGNNNSIIWNDTYDENDSLIFVIQDQIAENIANNLDIKISRVDKNAILNRPTHSLQAYENMSIVKSNMMSLDMFNFYYEDNNSNEYFSLLEKTIKLDSTYSEAYAYFSMFNFLSAVQNSFIGDDSVIESDSLFQSAMIYSEKALEYDDKNEIGLSINIMMPIVAGFLTCSEFEEFQPTAFEAREVIRKTKILMSHYPDSPLTNLLQYAAYSLKSITPIIGEESDDQLAEEFLKKSFDRAKDILEISPNDGISYYIFYLSTKILTGIHRSNHEFLDAADIVQEFVDFAEDHNLLSSMYP